MKVSAPDDAPSGASEAEGPSTRGIRVIAGMGASAGGLEAASEVLAHVPADAGVCIVFVAHLDPNRSSRMVELLARRSTLPVVEASESASLEPNRVYVIPPGRLLELTETGLHLQPSTRGGVPGQIDHLLQSLARHHAELATAIVLSGTGSDGASGIRAVKAVGGVTIAQDPETAEFDGMPNAAIATGLVDLVLPPEEIGRQLYTSHVKPRLDKGELERKEGTTRRIFQLLRSATGVDFSVYKTNTIERRLERRMMLRRSKSLDDYLKLLNREYDELMRLGEDLIIKVTHFFREPDSYEELANTVFQKFIEEGRPDDRLRVWIPGCATGEEAYSVAIAYLERFSDHPVSPELQLFATDVSERSIQQARSGRYPLGISNEVSPARLERFFQVSEGGYRISSRVRERCLFARQDITQDAPFSRIDLIICRNLLIYLNPSTQQKVLRVLHFALRPGGFLMLGDSESIGPLTNLFAPAGKTHRLFAKRDVNTPTPLRLNLPAAIKQTDSAGDLGRHGEAGHSRAAQRLMLEEYAVPAVVIDADFQILETFGRTALFLELPKGPANLNLLKMARKGIGIGLRRAFYDCRNSGEPTRREGLRFRSDGAQRVVDVSVAPLTAGEQTEPRFLVVFEERWKEPIGRSSAVSESDGALSGETDRIRQLEQDLEATRSHMESMIQDLEAANEELQSAHEEVLSSNEELQSTNEELDTAREELQSTNEEIGTVNEELLGRNDELERLNSDLENLLSSVVQVAIVIVSQSLLVRRFTPLAEELLNLRESDIGKPITELRPSIAVPDLPNLIQQVIRDAVLHESEVELPDGRIIGLWIRPYKDITNRIDGAVVTLSDLSSLRSRDDALRGARELIDALGDEQQRGLAMLDTQMRIQWTNRSFDERFGVNDVSLDGRSLADLGLPGAAAATLRSALAEALSGGGPKGRTSIVLDLSGRRVEFVVRSVKAGGVSTTLLLSLRDLGSPAGD